MYWINRSTIVVSSPHINIVEILILTLHTVPNYVDSHITHNFAKDVSINISEGETEYTQGNVR